MHPRRVIRQAAVDIIKGGATIAQDRVWGGDQPPVDVETVLMEEGPAILVYTRHDHAVEYPASGFGFVKRECDLCVEVLAANNFAVDDVLDNAGEQVEALLTDLHVPGQPSTEIRFHEQNIETTNQFGKPVGGAFIMFKAQYWMLWRQDPSEALEMSCPTDLGVVINGGPRIPLPVEPCDC